jgi:small-conductance mechanosensitive channel
VPVGVLAQDVADACGADPSWVCEQVFDWTGSEGWAEAADRLLGAPINILLIAVIAFVANRLIRRAIRRLTNTIAAPESQDRLRRLRSRAPASMVDTGSISLRAASRARTLGTVLRGIASTVIWTIAVGMILGELGINLGPLIAGAGIAGVALGFGAQSLVKDFLSGIFMLVEDQFGVGDIVDAGPASGTVEAFTLRTTRLRDVDGTVWHIPNGAITRIGNRSQQWSRALLDVEVALGTDLDRVMPVIDDVAHELWNDPAWRRSLLEAPEVWGVERLEAEAIAIRLVIKTHPGDQFPVMRALRRRLADTFAAEGIAVRPPQSDEWVRRDAGSSREVEPSDAASDGDA